MGQNCKVVHQPEEMLEITELNRFSHLDYAPAMQFIGSNIIFIGFEPFRGSYATSMLQRGVLEHQSHQQACEANCWFFSEAHHFQNHRGCVYMSLITL